MKAFICNEYKEIFSKKACLDDIPATVILPSSYGMPSEQEEFYRSSKELLLHVKRCYETAIHDLEEKIKT